MGFKLSLIMFVIMCAMGGGAYWYYNDTQERMAILNENNAKLETAVATNEAALEAQRKSFEAMVVENKKLQEAFTEIESMNRRLENKLSRHDIGNLGKVKPGPTEDILNGSSNNTLRCFEIISGSPLTEAELSATKPSEINPECWEEANPNFDPSIQSEAWKKKNL